MCLYGTVAIELSVNLSHIKLDPLLQREWIREWLDIIDAIWAIVFWAENPMRRYIVLAVHWINVLSLCLMTPFFLNTRYLRSLACLLVIMGM